MQIKHLPTSEITVHPIAALLPRNTESPAFRALVATIQETGILRPIPVNGFRAIAELDVLAAAQHLGLTSVPTVEIQRHDLRTTIVGWLAARQHYTKSQVAYLVYPFATGIIEESKARRIANLKQGNVLKPTLLPPADSPKGTGALSGLKTLEQVADAIGVSRKLLQYAGQIHKAFDAPETDEIPGSELRAKFEPLILEQDENGHSAGLGAVVAGIAGYKATRGQTVVPAPQLTLWDERIEKMFSPARFNGWDKLDAPTRERIAEKFRNEFFTVIPDELQAAILGPVAKRKSA